MRYLVYGLSLDTNLAVPGLGGSGNKSRSDVNLHLGLMPIWYGNGTEARRRKWYFSLARNQTGTPILRIWEIGSFFHLLYADGTEFFIDQKGTEIWARWPDELTLEDTATYLLGPIMGFVLILRGIICLHASAIAIDDKAVALLGPPEAGKSTTAAAFARSGYPVVTDDVSAILDSVDHFNLQPGYPRLRLWPDSVSTLYGTPDALPLLTPNWDKRYLDLTDDGCRFQTEPLALGAIYLLGERSNDSAAPFIQELSANDRMISLIANTYKSELKNRAMRAQEFEFLRRLVSQVPVRRVVPHEDPRYLSRLCDVILDDYARLNSQL